MRHRLPKGTGLGASFNQTASHLLDVARLFEFGKQLVQNAIDESMALGRAVVFAQLNVFVERDFEGDGFINGILDQLFARLDRFVGPDRPLDDDASMVVLKVREEVMLPSVSRSPA